MKNEEMKKVNAAEENTKKELTEKELEKVVGGKSRNGGARFGRR